MTRRFIPQRFIDYYDSPVHKHVILSKMIAGAPDGITVAELTDRSGFSDGTVRAFIRDLYYLHYIHISGWKSRRQSSYSPVYKLGFAKDAPKNPTKAEAAKVEKVEKVKPEAVDPNKPLYDHCNALLKALVPVRDEQGQYEVNRQYLNWISGGVYG
jgi:hypothetical protein